ncbi:MAG: peptide ABC transporter substrate-binding protein [Bacillota bacterium]|uniref:peptide ABC transporter substrate-binding protein n=1 Tax=Bacillus sp. RO2 TaxID=2723913 RepID=UPI00145F28EB|nr:peptide ABC transporter substrate-binding protein [Bacillus sp. RO2]MEA3320627.1 peptide ABC transporter substrate-binding protein [Bacillota bacterium]NMH74410.1 peptide ABC transporter substrate-binding protein [Bacillus sp. RO2]
MKKVMALLMTAMLVFVLAACTASNNAGTDTSEGTNNNDSSTGEKVLRLNNGSEPTSLDPPIGFDSYSWNALNNLMEGLTRLNDEHLPQEATAEKWDVSEDGKTYTFYIRDNAKWSNGDDVTAGDFEFAWKRLLNPDTASPAAFLGYFIEGGEAYNNGEGSADDVKVKAVDEKTLEVTLVAPQTYFLSVITNPAFFPINEKVASENPEWFSEADSFVGNGPFNLSEWEHESHIVMAKNDQYWDADAVKLDKVHWAMVNDTNTEYQMYQTGDLDTSGVPADVSEQLFKEGKVNVGEQAGTYFFRFGVEQEPFQNANIRKAFAMAVNQQDVVDYITKREEEPAKGFVAKGFNDPSGNDFRETNGDLVTFNAEEAKALLKKGMEEEGYETLPEVTLTYNTSDEHKRIAETLQQMFKDNLGVDVKLANMEWNVFLDAQKNLEFQFSRSSFLADYADPINFLENFQTGHSMNRTGWANSKYDELIQKALNEADEAKRFELMYEAEKVLFEEMPIIPLYFYNHVYLQNEAVKGIVRHPVGYIELKWADKE